MVTIQVLVVVFILYNLVIVKGDKNAVAFTVETEKQKGSIILKPRTNVDKVIAYCYMCYNIRRI